MIKQILIILLSPMLLLGCVATEKAKNSLFTSKKAEKKYISAYNKTMQLWPVPFEEKDIITKYGSTHVIISGPIDAEPLVLFHGLDASSTMWYPNIKSFTQKYRVYAIDNINESGKTVAKDGKFSNEDIIPYYNEVFDALKLNKINLLGTSAGGWRATYFAINSKDRLSKLVLIAPVETFTHVDLNPKTITAANFKISPTRKRLHKMVDNFSQKSKQINPLFTNQLYWAGKSSKLTIDILKMSPFNAEEFRKISCPVLVLVGDHDILNKPELVEIALKLMPNVKASIIKDAGHFITMDKQEEVDKRVMEFLGK